MNQNRSISRLAATAVAVLFAAAVASAQGHDHGQMQDKTQAQMEMQGKDQVIKIGKKGDIVFSKETQVGDVTLKAGHYQFQHREADGQHFVKFTELQMPQGKHQSGTLLGAKEAAEIKCTVEPLSKKVTQTSLIIDTAGGVNRITRIEVAGENVAHIL